MNILAFESSCDETSASVVKDGRFILSNVVASQVDVHALYGGVVPEIASRAHTEAVVSVTTQAIEKAGLTIKDIDACAVTNCPGLIGALLVGVNFAKSFAYSANLPLVPVHHLKSHVAANYVIYNGVENELLEPPFYALIVSGGNTLLCAVSSYTDFKIIGATRDDAVGECYDKVARLMGFTYPGGAKVDNIAFDGNENAIKFPEAQVKDHPFDFSFSGVKTFAVNYLHTASQKQQPVNKQDFCASFTKSITSAICSRVEKLFNQNDGQLTFSSNKLVLAGGVAANKHLRNALTELCKKYNKKLYIPPISLCGDNAAMVAAQAFYEFSKSGTKPNQFDKNMLNLNAYAVSSFDRI